MPNISLQKNKKEIYLSMFFQLSCYLLIIGLFFSRAALSISSALIFISGLTYFIFNKEPLTKPSLAYGIFPCVWIILLFSGFYTTDYNEWLKILFRDSILVLIPAGFLLAKQLSSPIIKKLLLFYCALSFICIIVNAIYALFIYEELSSKVLESKNITSIIGPVHNELGLLSVLGFILLFFFYKHETNAKLKAAYLSGVIFLFLAFHVLAYRFSLLTIYIIGLCYLMSLVIKYKMYRTLIITLTAFICILILMYTTLLPFSNRVNNTIGDIETIIYNKNPNYHSIAQRWAAVKCASEIVKKNPFIGVAPADLPQEMMKQYQQDSYLLIPENRVFIHNQFVFYAASLGLPFAILFFFTIILLIYKKAKHNPLLYWLMIPFLLNMGLENTLEKQITSVAMLFIFSLPDVAFNRKLI